MSEHIHCFSNPEKPGLVKLAAQRASDTQNERHFRSLAADGWTENEWSLKVSDAEMTLASITRSQKRLRKLRGKNIYRCTPFDARSIAIRYTALRSREWSRNPEQVRDKVLATMLIVAFGLSIFFSQAADLGTAHTLGITATVLTALTILMAYQRDNRTALRS